MEDNVISIEDLRFHALRNALYHTARRRLLEDRSRWLNLLVVMGGAATVAKFENMLPHWDLYLGIAITFVGALQLVFDFSGRARTHETLQRRYYELLGEIEECLDPKPEIRSKMMGQIARISGEEPPTYRALEAIAYNEATDALYGKERAHEKCLVTMWQSATRHIFYWHGVDFIGSASSDRKECHSKNSAS